jgi:hypothetical protein
VLSPNTGVTVSTASDGPSGPGVVLAQSKPIAHVARSIPGLTTIGLHRVNGHEERTQCSVYAQSNVWNVQSWVNWATTPDAWTKCAARAFSIPAGLATPPYIRQGGHAQDVGDQSPQK